MRNSTNKPKDEKCIRKNNDNLIENKCLVCTENTTMAFAVVVFYFAGGLTYFQ